MTESIKWDPDTSLEVAHSSARKIDSYVIKHWDIFTKVSSVNTGLGKEVEGQLGEEVIAYLRVINIPILEEKLSGFHYWVWYYLSVINSFYYVEVLSFYKYSIVF